MCLAVRNAVTEDTALLTYMPLDTYQRELISRPTIGAMHHKHNRILSYEASYMWEARYISKTHAVLLSACQYAVQLSQRGSVCVKPGYDSTIHFAHNLPIKAIQQGWSNSLQSCVCLL